jgi:hypothetical protein
MGPDHLVYTCQVKSIADIATDGRHSCYVLPTGETSSEKFSGPASHQYNAFMGGIAAAGLLITLLVMARLATW